MNQIKLPFTQLAISYGSTQYLNIHLMQTALALM